MDLRNESNFMKIRIMYIKNTEFTIYYFFTVIYYIKLVTLVKTLNLNVRLQCYILVFLLILEDIGIVASSIRTIDRNVHIVVCVLWRMVSSLSYLYYFVRLLIEASKIIIVRYGSNASISKEGQDVFL